MPTKNLIAAGIGFAPGSVRFVITRGLGGTAAPPLSISSPRLFILGGGSRRQAIKGIEGQRLSLWGAPTQRTILRGDS